MFEHPFTLEQFAAYARGSMSPQDAERVAAYLRTSPAARKLVMQLTELAQVVANPLEEPPVGTIAKAKALFREVRKSQSESLWAALRRVAASLVFDSRPRAALAGLRGAASTYQLSFESELGELDLDIEPPTAEHATTWRVLGQISAAEGQRADVIALATTGTFTPFTSAPVDEHGVFTLNASKGTYDVLISMQDALIVVPAIEFK